MLDSVHGVPEYPIDQTSQKIDFESKVKNFDFACFSFAFEVNLQSKNFNFEVKVWFATVGKICRQS